MKVFVTGATGFIGGRLVEKLIDRGITIHSIVRSGSEHKVKDLQSKIRGKKGEIRFFPGNVLDRDSLQYAIEGCDQVYHLAALASVWAREPGKFFQVNVEGSRNVLNAAAKNGVNSLVMTSTGGTLPSAVNTSMKEKDTRPVEFKTEYENTKYQAEREVLEFDRDNIKTVVVNPTRVFGPGRISESNAMTKMLQLYLRGIWRFVPGEGNTIGNYVFIEDVVDGHILAMEKGKTGEKYILGGENLTFNMIMNLMKEVTGKERKILPLPQWLIMTVSRMEKIKARLFSRPPLITPEWAEKYAMDAPRSSQKAQKELGYKITPFREGLQKTYIWLKQSNSM